MIDIEKIAKQRFGENFKFRKGQLETIEDILKTFFEGEKNLYLLEAPTGAGKSIIALLVADCINSVNLKGYILVSDLSLFDQYTNDLRYFPQFGYVKGIDNYTCAVNLEKFSLGDCRIKNMSYEEAEDLPCFTSCGYLMDRKKAISSPTTILTYAFWLIQRNYVEAQQQGKGKGVPFPKRDFTICDEAHKLSDIVQNHFSPRISLDSMPKVEEFYNFLRKRRFRLPSHPPSHLRNLIGKLLREETEKKLFPLLKELESFLLEYVTMGTMLKESAASTFPGEREIPKDWRHAMGQADWFKDSHCKFQDYNHIIAQVGTDFMIKNPQDSKTVMFNCLEEKYMMNRYFHDQAGFKLLMTATMGDPTDFLRNIGGVKCKHRKMESTFDFEKSPIYFHSGKRMSLAARDSNFEWLKKQVTDIVVKHPNDSGIIHSGSYAISARLHEALDPQIRERIVTYTTSREKEEAMKRFILNPNMILMGPSLLEGIDLFEERSRFQVFLKVPYPSLGDKYVAAKMNYSPEWYAWKTSLAILQGVGRSVRSEKDWAVTHVLDGCFADLLNHSRKNFPPEFLARIKLIKN